MRLLVPLLMTAVLAACHKPAPPAEQQSQPSAQVSVVTVEEKSRPVTEEVVGTIRSETRARVEAKVSGRIERMNVDLGQQVSEGEVIAVIDAQEVKARLDRAKADHDQALREWKRTETLLARQVASRQEFDNAEARYRAAKAALNEAQTMQDYIEVRAPFAGVVARRLADPGDFASPGKPIVEIENPESLRFEADVPEALIGSVASGEEVMVTIPSINRAVTGKVAEISPAADPNSRTFPVRINLPSVLGLRAGQFGRVAIPVAQKISVRVPTAALVVRGQMEMVFVAEGNHAIMRLVRTGKTIDKEIEILSGVSPGDGVIVDGSPSLVDGQPIVVQP